MKVGLRGLRGGFIAALMVIGLPVVTPVASSVVGDSFIVATARAQSAGSIVVEGNRRIEADTVRSYFKPGPSGRIDSYSVDSAYKALYETGLFQDIKISTAGGRIVVSVIENPVINRVAFEGNKKVKDEQLQSEIQSKARGTLSKPMVQSDTARIVEIYRRSGRFDVRVEPKIIEQPNNRVDLVFEVNEGGKTGIKNIDFVGNRAFSSYRLKDVIKTRETNLLSFLGSADIYDPDRIEADRDLIRRYYLKNGYADVRVVAAMTEYDPAKKGFLVTFTIEEGEQYRVASVDIQSSVPALDTNALRSFLRVGQGSVYNAESVEKTVEDMSIEAAKRGFAFVSVRPRGERNFESHTVALVFVVEEGSRVYIERINVRGNTRTRDYVIRREFDVAEGDAYNRALVDRAERRLKNLDFFKSVKIAPEPGSSPDRVVLNVDVEEKSTGDFGVSGGYSTADGFMAELTVQERNLLGRGLQGRASIQYGQRARGYNLSLVEPYLMGYRLALGLDLYQRQQLASSTVSYDTDTIGVGARLGISLREDLSLQARYSIYRQEITLPDYLNNCISPDVNLNSTLTNPTTGLPYGLGAHSPGAVVPGDSCYGDGETSLPARIALANGPAITSLVGYTLAYNVLDNNKNPTSGLYAELKQDFAGVGGDVQFIRTTADSRFYYPVVSDIVGMLRVQGGHVTGWGSGDLRMLDHFQLGPNLVRGFAVSGIGPRDVTPGSLTNDALGGTMYWGATAELQMPFWFLPKEIGLRGAVYADAGSLWNYKGPTSWSVTGETVTVDDSNVIRSSVGVGLIWDSPFGPLRFDYAVPMTKGPYDREQRFRFGGGASF
ncbi:MAG: outer membrane protein assembly factor BamA [Xanthobacteraceae bacterium]|nr:MAG: outer membrane protein assembly factor BamA [Xanthobacteraceae bacterium]